MSSARTLPPVVWKAGIVVLAFVVAMAAAGLFHGCAAYHRQPGGEGGGAAVCRAVVDRTLEESDGELSLEMTVTSGEAKGKRLPGKQSVAQLGPQGRMRAGQRCLVTVESTAGQLTARVATRERDGFLLGAAAALVALLGVTAGRKGLATAGSAVWAVVLIVTILLPATLAGLNVAAVSLPLALAIAVPTLLAVGGANRKSLAAVAGTCCGLVAGGLAGLGFVNAMALTGMETSFGPYHHLENVFWFAPALHAVQFRSLLVAGMLLAGLGAVMDVSMAVASTVAEVHRTAPATRRALFRAGLAAGRDIVGVMIFTLAMIYLGSELIFFISLGSTGWAGRWLALANFEEIAAELARAAATAAGMALCAPATALAAALLHAKAPAPQADRPAPAAVPLRRLAGPLLAAAACVVAAGLSDELALRRDYTDSSGSGSETAGRIVAFEPPVTELDTQTADPHARGFYRSQLAVVQPYFGAHAGERLAVRVLQGPNPANQAFLRCGMAAHLLFEEGGDAPTASIFKPPLRYRWGLVAAVTVALLMLAASGAVGLRVLLMMAASLVLLLGGVVPLLVNGHPPLAIAGGYCLLMLAAVFAVAGGLNRKALSTIAGCALGLATAAVLLVAATAWLGFSGTQSVAGQFLMFTAERVNVHYDYAGLLAAGLLIALFGLVLDTAVTVAAAVAQVVAARPGLTRREAAVAGMNTSRDITGTMVLTLLFALVGLRLPVLLLRGSLGMSAAELVNGEAGSLEILHALIGSIALVATGPATALAASFLMVGRPQAQERKARIPRGVATALMAAVALTIAAGATAWCHLRQQRLSRVALLTIPASLADQLAAATQARRDHRLGDALLALWHARDAYPSDPTVRTETAYTYMTQRWTAQARREIEAALRAGADDSVTHYVAGVVYAWADQAEDAERHLRRAIALDPANAAAREALGRLFGPSP